MAWLARPRTRLDNAARRAQTGVMADLLHTPYADGVEPFTVGARALGGEDWIELDSAFCAQLREKERLAQLARAQASEPVFLAEDGSHDAQSETAGLLLSHLTRRFPEHYQFHDGVLSAPEPGLVWRLSDFAAAPLELAGRCVQEDLCLIGPPELDLPLVAASLSFPSSWALSDKIGRPLEAVHGPVPGYRERLASPVARMFERMPAGVVVTRKNWSIDPGGTLHRPAPAAFEEWARAVEAGPAALHVRVERQTIRKLERSGCILFTIKIHLDPFTAFAEHPRGAELARALHSQLAALEEAQARYKGLGPWRAPILAILEKLATR